MHTNIWGMPSLSGQQCNTNLPVGRHTQAHLIWLSHSALALSSGKESARKFSGKLVSHSLKDQLVTAISVAASTLLPANRTMTTL